MSKTAAKAKEERRPRVGEALNVWIATELMQEFKKVCAEDLRTQTAQLTLILRDYLQRRRARPEGQGAAVLRD